MTRAHSGLFFAILAFAASCASDAQATFSVVAAEPSSGRIGGAGTSCIGSYSVSVIFGAVPGHGAVHAQAQLNEPSKLEAVKRLAKGEAPSAILAALIDPSFDAGASERQFGIVDLEGRSAGYTGPDTMPHASHRLGTVDGITYAIQGNILTGGAVLDRMEAAFAKGCDLPDRLVRSLASGDVPGEGDSRCTPLGIPADSGFLQVQEAGGSLVLSSDVVGTAPENPVSLLLAEYGRWRERNPCPLPPAEEKDDPPPAAEPASDDGCSIETRPSDTTVVPLVVFAILLGLWSRRHRPR